MTRERELRLGAERQDLLEEVVVGFEDDEGLLAEDVDGGRVDADQAAPLRCLVLMEVPLLGPCPRSLRGAGAI